MSESKVRWSSEPGFTPGLWSVDDPGDGTVGMGEGFMVMSRANCVAECLNGDFSEADAFLIAAAPDLYEALVRAERKLAAYVGICSGDKELTNTVLPMARAALTRAVGAPHERE